MAWSVTDIIPVSLNIQECVDVGNSTANDQSFKIVPLDSSGAIVDCTGLASLLLNASNYAAPLVGRADSISPTIVSADATGISFTITGTQFLGMLGVVGVLTMKMDIIGINSTNQLLAVGQINFRTGQ